MRHHLFTMIFLTVLFSALPADALPLSINVSDGSDGPLLPTVSTTLLTDEEGRFNFTAVTINEDINVGFSYASGNAISILSIGDIIINGTLDALGYDLILATSGNLYLNNEGLVRSDSISISATEIIINGEFHMPVAENTDSPDISLGTTTGINNGILNSVSGAVTITSGSGLRTLLYDQDGMLVPGTLEPLAGLLNPGSILNPPPPTNYPSAPVPEPATLLLLGCGLLGMAGIIRTTKHHS